MEWSKKRINELVRHLVPKVTRIEITFPSSGVIRVLITTPDIRGVQSRVQSVLDQALPAAVERVEVLVVRGASKGE